MKTAPPIPSPDDRRVAPRLRPALGTTCRFDAADNPTAPALGLVWNISLTGVSMLVASQPKSGEILTGELTLENGRSNLAIMLRVIHVKPIPTGDFMLGAQFLRELTPAELTPFVDPHAVPVK